MADDLPPSRLLLVEGADDEHVVRRLCDRRQDMPDFDIVDKRGFPNLQAAIGPEIKAPGRTALAARGKSPRCIRAAMHPA